ncbi:MAG: tetratricopeptide repeat protein [Bacteroidota bacterium]
MKVIKYLSLFLLLGIILSACSNQPTKKSQANVKGLKKAFHDLNARFNGYFNANVIVKESFANLSDQYQDNYNQILNLYQEAANEDAAAVSSELDEAIKKSAVVISLHRPSKWADDSYLIIGKSQYLKKEYEEAAETFNYIIKEYDPKNIAKKKAKAKRSTKKRGSKKKRSRRAKKKRKKASKKKGKKKTVTTTVEALNDDEEKDSYFMKHRPIREDAMVWLARTYVELEQYDDANFLLRRIERDQELPKFLEAEAKVVEAYVFLKQKNYDLAIEPLTQGMELTTNKKKKTRYAYIIAQIHQIQGRAGEAFAAYEQVLKLNPNYDMEFRTRLNLLLNGWQSGQQDAPTALKQLERLAKDEKNEEYRDQVYFAMAEIALKEGVEDEAVTYLKKSLEFNVNNQPQKADSYLQLANIYFTKEAYVPAKNYYDSTLLVLAKKDERYPLVKNYAENLSGIAREITTIQLQDSLLALRDLDEAGREALAKKLKKEQEENKANLASANTRGKTQGNSLRNDPSSQGRSNLGTTSNPSKSEYWAYNTSTVKRGKKDFEKNWGESRVLEDDWRRSNRRNLDFEEEEEEDPQLGAVYVSEAEIKDLLKDIPETPEQVAAAELKIASALFTLGNLYRDKLSNDKKAIETLEELMRRFPENENDLEAMYMLYVLYDGQGNTAKAEFYKNKVMNKYPESRHAMVLKDPKAFNAVEDAEAKLASYYDQIYKQYESEQYAQAKQMINESDSLFGAQNTYRPKFALLSAFIVGAEEGREPYKKALAEITRAFPKTEEGNKALEILTLLGSNNERLNNNTADQAALFVHKPAEQHYVLVSLSSQNIKQNDAKAAISDYNRKYHSLDNLKISSLLLDLQTSILIVRRFSDEAKALKYYQGAKRQSDEFLEEVDANHGVYIISQSNYKTLLRLRKIDAFKTWFAEQYPN